MQLGAYNEWISIYNDDIEATWEGERKELRKVTMIFCAFQNELEKLKTYLGDELAELKSEFRKKDFQEKRKKFRRLVKSEKIDFEIAENETPDIVSLQPSEINTEDFFIESPNTHARTPSPQPQKDITAQSPVLGKMTLAKTVRKSSKPPSVSNDTPTTSVCDDSDILECSVIEDTPEVQVERKSKKSRLRLKQLDKGKENKRKQVSTLTQMFFEPKKRKKPIESNLPSMTVTEMINLINAEDSDTESDVTVDNLDIPQPSTPPKPVPPVQGKREPQVGPEEVVRGNARRQLKGWSCKECMEYYEGLDLPPAELQKKKDLCSKHRFKFQPRQETYDGFWELTFGPSPKTQEEEESMVLNYKKKL